jgi:hypothetical protein
MKALMAEHNAVFGGEHSGHYYFRDFWRADTGMLTVLHVLAALAEQDRPLSELVAGYSRYAASGEINSQVADVAAKLDHVETAYRDKATVDRLDGLTVNLGDGRWFNLRPSNTEPLLRLNVEAPDQEAVDALRDGMGGSPPGSCPAAPLTGAWPDRIASSALTGPSPCPAGTARPLWSSCALTVYEAGMWGALWRGT